MVTRGRQMESFSKVRPSLPPTASSLERHSCSVLATDDEVTSEERLEKLLSAMDSQDSSYPRSCLVLGYEIATTFESKAFGVCLAPQKFRAETLVHIPNRKDRNLFQTQSLSEMVLFVTITSSISNFLVLAVIFQSGSESRLILRAPVKLYALRTDRWPDTKQTDSTCWSSCTTLMAFQ